MFRNLAVVLTYSTVAVAVGMILPQFVSGIDADEALTVSGVLLVGFALLHEIFIRQFLMSRMASALSELRLAGSDVMGELNRARDEVRRIYETIESAASRKGASKRSATDVDEVVAEVRLLQKLVNQLSGQAAPKVAVQAANQAGETARETRPGPDSGAGDGRAVEARPPVVYATPPVSSGAPPVIEGLDDDAILQIIQDGLRRDRVDVMLQPIVSLPQRKRRFFEAFTRIRVDDGDYIVPEQYIAIAEREGLITGIDNMLLFRCVQTLRKTNSQDRHVGFFCNISPYTLADGGFFHEFVEFMSENAELAPNLIFEFAQATIANRDENIVRQLGRLAGMGFRFSMDQVASLNLDYEDLSRQHIRFVKIEAGALMREIGDPSAKLDRGVQFLKRALERHGIDLIVEKIETEATLLDLLDYQIDFGQGYLFGEPQRS